MTDRIKQIMEAERVTPAQFADNLGIGRAIVSHIQNGRNKPSLDVITKILTKMPQINSEWLLTGKGSMYKTKTGDDQTISTSSTSSFPDLFSQPYSDNRAEKPDEVLENSVNTAKSADNVEYEKETQDNMPPIQQHLSVNEKIIYKEAPVKKIRQIIIYYTDNTFETFASH
ncbi:XRE family transcriptional regulator [Dysgonomonas sp. 520]|nr:XRE family transcriptional regulator [Dysgonomonas sp. 520]